MNDVHTRSENNPQHQKRSTFIYGWMRGYRKAYLRPDIIAGMTTAAVVVPKSMAYSSICGLPVEIGLYSALIPLVIYAILGSSRLLSVSSTSAIAILTASEIALLAPGGSPLDLVVISTTLAFLVGAFLLLAGVFRMGFISNFISDPVLTGFRAGIGVVIVVDQIPKLLGIHIIKGGFFSNIFSISQQLPETVVPALLLSMATLVLIIVLEHLRPNLPAPLFAVILGIAASWLLGLGQFGVELAGKIPVGLPSPILPDISLVRDLWPGALGIALMAFTESIAAGRSFMKKGDPPLDSNRELFALGAANLMGSFFRIIPAGGGTSQTAVNEKAGACTQASGIVTAIIILAVLLVLSPLISLMPHATLAAVVVATSIGLINPADFRKILKIRQTEFWWAIIAFIGVVLFGTLEGILIAVAISIFTIMYYANHPPIYALGRKYGTDIFRPVSHEHPEDETIPGLLIMRTEGRMHFASTPRIKDRFWKMIEEAGARVLVVDFSAVPDIEYTALQMLINAQEKLRNAGTTLWLASLNPMVLDVVKRSPLNQILGKDRIFYSIEEAVKKYEERL